MLYHTDDMMTAERTQKETLSVILLILACVILLAGSASFWFYTVEDAFISFRYCDNMIQGKGLVYNEGERVEGYTHFLWLVLIAISRLFWPFPLAAKIPGVISAVVLLFLLSRMNAVRNGAKDRLSGSLAALLVAVCPGVQMWSVSGLETLLFSTGIVAALFFHEKNSRHSNWFSGICFGLTTLTRPEGVLFFGLFLSIITIQRRYDVKQILAYVGGFSIIVLPHLIFRMYYYDALIPNTFWVKSRRFKGGGFLYFKRYSTMTGILMLPVALYGLKNRNVRSIVMPMLVMAIGYLAYVYYVGGDWMPYGRFIVPAIPLVALAAARTAILSEGASIRKFLTLTLCLGMIISITSAKYDLVRFRPSRYREVLTWEMEHMKDWKKVAGWLKNNFSEKTYMSTGLAGVIPYYSGLKTLDRGGLNDREIAKIIYHSSSAIQESEEISELILERKPDLVMIESLSFNMLRREPLSAETLNEIDQQFLTIYTVSTTRIDNRYFSWLTLNWKEKVD